MGDHTFDNQPQKPGQKDGKGHTHDHQAESAPETTWYRSPRLTAAPSNIYPNDIIAMQKQYGNRAVQRWLMKRGTGAISHVQRARVNWYNVRVDVQSRMQNLIRQAQRRQAQTLQMEIVVQPNHIDIANSQTSGRSPAGSSEPDGFAVYQATERALALIADSAPTSRRVYTVVLERRGAEWTRRSMVLTGETPGTASPAIATPSGQQTEIGNILNRVAGANRSLATIDLLIESGGVRIVNWRGRGSHPARTGTTISTQRAVASATRLMNATSSPHPVIYATEFQIENGAWQLQSARSLGEVRQRPADQSSADTAPPQDEGQMVIDEIKGTRRLILNTAAQLIAEQDPTRIENILTSVGPFAIGRLARLGRLGRLGRLTRLIGRPGRTAFGEVRFRGLVQNRQLRQLTHQEIYNAFRNTPFTPSSHAIMRLKHVRTERLGMTTLNDVASHLNRGIIQNADRGVIAIERGNFRFIINPETNIIVTISPM